MACRSHNHLQDRLEIGFFFLDSCYFAGDFNKSRHNGNTILNTSLKVVPKLFCRQFFLFRCFPKIGRKGQGSPFDSTHSVLFFPGSSPQQLFLGHLLLPSTAQGTLRASVTVPTGHIVRCLVLLQPC